MHDETIKKNKPLYTLLNMPLTFCRCVRRSVFEKKLLHLFRATATEVDNFLKLSRNTDGNHFSSSRPGACCI